MLGVRYMQMMIMMMGGVRYFFLGVCMPVRVISLL